MVKRIVSGGQTGADRGGLDAAIELGIAQGGFCPKGRLAEDGAIPARYRLRETPSAVYAERTRRNVETAEATVLFTAGRPPAGARSPPRSRALGKPLLHIDLARLTVDAAIAALRRFPDAAAVRVLNVAGSRESQAPGIAADVKRVIVGALS